MTPFYAPFHLACLGRRVCAAGLLCLLVGARAGRANEDYDPNWESLQRHQAVPEWLRDAKFGIYTHWGVYSVPAYNNEHYIQHMHRDGEYSKLGTYRRHVAIYGPLDKFDYHDFIPMFRGERFDADAWADLFVKAGARFAGPVAEHHDGFSMWDSALTPFNAADMGPKRDVVGELAQAIRRRGLKFMASLHHELNYTNVRMKTEWAGSAPQYAKLYGSTMDREEWMQLWRDKCVEVVDLYHPDLIYHDAWLERVRTDYLQQYLAHYFNAATAAGQGVTVSFKGEDIPAGVGIRDFENELPAEEQAEPWLCDFSIGTGYSYSWGYTDGMEYRTPREILHRLIEVTARNGTMLLNLSPKADGTIPEAQQQIVLKVGQWLWSFGEAIYETRPFAVASEQSGAIGNVFYTCKGDTVYAILLDWPGVDLTITLSALTPERLGFADSEVTMLGLKKLEPCESRMSEEGLQVKLRRGLRQPSEIAHVLRIRAR